MAVDANNSIQKAFLDGINEVFSIMFTQHCLMYFLNDESTEVNIYGETDEKVYGEPYELTAKVSYDQPKGESPEQTVERKAIITIPTKQLIQNNISFLNEADWERFRQAKLVYEGTEYLVDIVKPKTLVADIWQFFDFYCTEDKKSSLDVPEEEVEPETTGDTYNTEESGADEEGDIYGDY